MRTFLVLFLALSLISLSAAENASLTDVFSASGSDIAPPRIADVGAPGEGGSRPPALAPQKEAAAGAAMEMASAESEELNSLTLIVKDFNTGELITNAHIRIIMNGDGGTANTLRYIGDGGYFKFDLSPGSWDIVLKLDKLDTSGKDYYGELEVVLSSDKNETVYMQPVGSLMGEVTDDDSRLVPFATVKFECSGDYGDLEPVTTDEFGSFSADWLPAGSCKVSALNGARAGSTTVVINHGELTETSIGLGQSIAIDEIDYSLLMVLVAIVAILVVFFYMRKPKKPRIQEDKEIQTDKRMGDIISALDESEKRIIENLLRKGGKSMQNHLCRELGYPKSSMSRAIGGLEARGLVKTERLGRIKRVQLSEWFLSGKKP